MPLVVLDTDSECSGPSRPLLPRPSTSRKIVPRLTIIFYLIVMMLDSFVFYSVWYQIVPYVRDYYVRNDVGNEVIPTLAAQLFILVNYMAAIFGGLVGDIASTRYQVIFVSRLLLFLAFGVTIILTYFNDQIPFSVRGYLIGAMLFFLASTMGIIKTNSFVFGVEQLDDETNAMKRQGFRRLVFFFYEIGRLLSMFFGTFEFGYLESAMANPRLTTACITLAVALLTVTLFIFPKRYYRFNRPEGGSTIRVFAEALNVAQPAEDDEADDDDAEYWRIGAEANNTRRDNRIRFLEYRRNLVRRISLLVLIFFIFGPFYAGDYFAGIVYPFQSDAKQYNPNYGYLGSFAVLAAIPILEAIYRTFSLAGNKTNFYFIGVAMVLSMISISISDFSYDNGTAIAKTLLTSFSQYFFYPAGFDLADIEAPASLRGFSTGLFLGLGTFFGALIYIIWIAIPPMGIYPEDWIYARVGVGSLIGFAILCFIATGYLYHKAKDDCYRARAKVAPDLYVDSINHIPM